MTKNKLAMNEEKNMKLKKKEKKWDIDRDALGKDQQKWRWKIYGSTRLTFLSLVAIRILAQ